MITQADCESLREFLAGGLQEFLIGVGIGNDELFVYVKGDAIGYMIPHTWKGCPVFVRQLDNLEVRI